MTEIETTSLEKTSLEAHVDLCAMRYKQLDTRLTTLEVKMDGVAQAITNNSTSMKNVVITSTATIVTSILGLITAILLKF